MERKMPVLDFGLAAARLIETIVEEMVARLKEEIKQLTDRIAREIHKGVFRATGAGFNDRPNAAIAGSA